MPVLFCPQCGYRVLSPDNAGRCHDCARYPVEPFRFDTSDGARLAPMPDAGPVLMSSQPGSLAIIADTKLSRFFWGRG